MRQSSAERTHRIHHANAEASINENTDAVAEQGAMVAPEKATWKNSAPKEQKTATAEEGLQALAAKGASKRAPSKGAKILAPIGRPYGRHLGRDYESYGLAGP